MDKLNTAVFLMVVETGSFSKAAERLGYTQAGVSYIVSTMEEELGIKLFVRDYSGIRLTAEGREILPYIKQVDISSKRLRQKIDDMSNLEVGSIKVQIFDSISIHWIPGIIKKYKADYPGIEIELITEENSKRAEEMVVSQEVDCGFFLTEPKCKVDSFPLLKEAIKVVVSPDDPIAKMDVFPIEKLGDYPFISMAFDTTTGIRDLFVKNGQMPRTAFVMDNDYAAMAMASAGLGFCIFPELLLRDAPYEIKTLDFAPPQSRQISIATKDINNCSNAAKKFIEYTISWVKEQYREQF
ncbi:MAG: LysR family transcriptional regulator [Lachnospiraceae bacterium]|jgi:DNA-binding transcriptional LysR family regulator